MPSINDVYNELVTANTTLGQLHADVLAEKNATDLVKSSVDKLDSDVNSGFATLSSELQTLTQIENAEVKVLFHLTQQSDAIICILEKISKNTCEILNEVTAQTGLQTRIRDDADALRDIAEFAHPDAALQRTKLAELRAEIEKCCPPKPQRVPCGYKPCPHPEPLKQEHVGGGIQPVP